MYAIYSIIGFGWGFYFGQFWAFRRAMVEIGFDIGTTLNKLGTVFLGASVVAVIALVLACMVFGKKTAPIQWMLAVFVLGAAIGVALHTSGIRAFA